MKTRWVEVVTLMVVIAGMGSGCVDNDRSLAIVFNVAPDDECEYSVQDESSAVFISSGFLDVGVNSVYTMFPQIHNYMPNNYNEGKKVLNTMDVQIEGFEMSYRWLAGRDTINSFPDLLALESQGTFIDYNTATVGAASSEDPGKVFMSVRLFSSKVGDTLASSGMSADEFRSIVLGVRIRAFGHTLGGQSIKSNELIYPISFCNGCLGTAVLCCADTTKETIEPYCLLGQPMHVKCPSCSE